MNIQWTFLLVATLMASSICRAQEFVPIPSPSPAYELNGFAVMPPTGQRWLLKSGATLDQVRFSRSTDLGGHHTVIAWAESLEWPRAIDSASDLIREITARVDQSFKGQSRYSNVRFDVVNSGNTELSCGEFSLSAEDRGVPYAPGKVFTIQGWEMYCLHPSSPNRLVLKLAYSQRFLQPGKLLPLDSELKMFREGVKVRPVSASGETANTTSNAKKLYRACIPIETKNGLAGSSSRAPMKSQNASQYAHLLCSVIADDCAKEPQSELCKKSMRNYGIED